MPKIIQVPDSATAPDITPSTPSPKAKIVNVPDSYQFGSDSIPRFKDVPQGIGGSTFEDALSLLPMAGGMLGDIPGAAAGALLRQVLTKNPSLGQAGIDTLLQGVIPAGVGKALEALGGNVASKIASKITNSKINPTLAEGLANKTSKFIMPEAATTETAAANALPAVQRNPMLFQGSVAEPLAKIPYNQTSVSNIPINKTVDQALSDVSQVRNFKLATGEPYTIEQLALNRAVGKGYSSGNQSIDPDAILKELTGPKSDVYNEAIRPDVRQKLTDFMGKVKEFEPETQGNSMIRYAKHRLIFDLAAYGVGHEVGGPLAGGAALILGNQAITKLMGSDFIGNLALKSLDTPTNSAMSPIITKAILGTLRGTTAYLQLPDGKKEQVRIDDNGQILPK